MSTDLAPRALTDKQAAVVRACIETGEGTKCAEGAGYSSPAHDAWVVMRLPHVKRAIAEGAHLRLQEGVPLALKTIHSIISDPQVSARVRADAAFKWLDRAGYVPPKAPDADNGLERDISTMDKDELRQFISQAEHRLATEAVDITPKGNAQEDDLLA